MTTGILFGSLVGAVNRFSESARRRSGPVRRIVLLRTTLYLAGLLIVAAFVSVFFATFICSWETLAEISGQ